MILDSMLYKPCIEYLKKEPYSGSYCGMRYRLWNKKETYEEDGKEKSKIVALSVCAYKDEWSFENTPEENKIYKDFDFSDDGLNEALEWLSKKQDEFTLNGSFSLD